MSNDKKTLFSNFKFNKSSLASVFIFAIFFILAITFLSYYQLQRLMAANNWVTHTYQVIEATDSSLYNLTDLEAHQRGYLITSNNQFIFDMDEIRLRLNTNLNLLSGLTKDNPHQSKRVKNFIKVADERLSMLNQVMQLKMDNKLNTPDGMETFRRGQSFSNQVRQMGQEINSVELVLLGERTNSVLGNVSYTEYVLIIGGCVSSAILILAFFMVNVFLNNRNKAETTRRMIESRMRSIIDNSNDMIAALDMDYRFIIFNEAYQVEFRHLFNKTITLNMALDDALSKAPLEKNKLLERWQASLDGKEYTEIVEFGEEGHKNVYEITSSLITQDDNQMVGAVHIVRNINNRIQEQFELKQSNEKLQEGMRELQEKNDQISLLVEMSDVMLACHSQEELSNIMPKYCQRMLKFSQGYLFLMHPSKNYLEIASSWGVPNLQEKIFTPDKCWAIRLGHIHQVNPAHDQLVCDHVQVQNSNESTLLCIPLMAQNDIYGLLYLEMMSQHTISENQRLLINAFAELTALALANVRLRDNLRHQSIRDPLTGLYNRRYLEDFMFKQLHQAERGGLPIAILMLDVDHFKKINDTYGHDAGDLVLKELGQILHDDIRMGDLASRYGGEEFIVIFYNTNLEAAKIRAEEIRASVAKLQIKYGAQQVGKITISIGISVFPDDAKAPADLIEAADRALYVAKNSGRDRVVVFSSIKQG